MWCTGGGPGRRVGDAGRPSTASAPCITAIATIVFLISKFTEGAWVVVIAIPAFVFLFLRIHAYYERARKELRIDETPEKPEPKYTIVIVPVNRISRLTEHALCEAESLGQEVIAVTVVLRGADEGAHDADTCGSQWRKWDPGVPLHVLYNEYASVVQPIVGFIDEVRARAPRLSDRRPHPGHPAGQAALPDPAQPDRPGPLVGAALPRATSSSPGSRCRSSDGTVTGRAGGHGHRRTAGPTPKRP